MARITREIIRYSLGGLVAFVITSTALFFMVEALHMHYFTASLVAYGLGFTVNFFYQAWFTFQTKRAAVKRRFAMFLAVQAVGFAIFSLSLYFLVETYGMFYALAFVFSVILTFAVNFAFSKFLVFRAHPVVERRSSWLQDDL